MSSSFPRSSPWLARKVLRLARTKQMGNSSTLDALETHQRMLPKCCRTLASSPPNRFLRTLMVFWMQEPLEVKIECASMTQIMARPRCLEASSSFERFTALEMFTSGPLVSSNPGASHRRREQSRMLTGRSTSVFDCPSSCPMSETASTGPPSLTPTTQSELGFSPWLAPSALVTSRSWHPARLLVSVLLPLPVAPMITTWRRPCLETASSTWRPCDISW
eukprot:754269-Hanusia_phi.AAC.1